MPGGRNGSGTFILPEASFVAGSTISSAAVNDNFSTIATALSQSIAVDGQTPITGSLKFANGAAASPSISTSGDSGTGFSFVTGSHAIQWSFNGVLGGTLNNNGAGGALFNANLSVGGNLAVTGTTNLTGSLSLSGTGALGLPDGTTAQRPGTPTQGMVRFNSTLGVLETFDGTNWISLSPITPPQGRLTPTSGSPVISADAIGVTSIFYTPYIGNLCPVWDGTSFVMWPFNEITLTLTSGIAGSSTIYDVFAAISGGALVVGMGPAWSASGANAGARGTGAGTTQLQYSHGMLTNANIITLNNNGSGTYPNIAVNQATYLGSLYIDVTAGQVTCHQSYGQSRKFGIWNNYNRTSIILQCGDPTANWAYNTNTIRASNGSSANVVTGFAGVAEEWMDVTFTQAVGASTGSANQPSVGIGKNSIIAMNGTRAAAWGGGSGGQKSSHQARLDDSPYIGINNYQSLENGGATGGTFYGTQTDMLLRAMWRG